MFHRILIPLDGSELAERALPPAVQLAQAAHSEIILLSVLQGQELLALIPSGNEDNPAEALTDATSEANGYLALQRRLWAKEGVHITTRLGDGEVATTILAVAEEEEVDCIVLSTHGRTGLSRLVLGSVAEKVVDQAHCPVLVVHSAHPWEKIVATVDGSPLAEAAVAPAIALANATGRELTFLRVQPYLTSGKPQDIDLYMLWEYGPHKSREELAEMRGLWYLDNLLQLCEQLNKPVQTVVKTGDPAEEIIRYANEQKPDLLIMATHGYTGLKRLWYGSVVSDVFRHVPCAVLVLHPKKSEI